MGKKPYTGKLPKGTVKFKKRGEDARRLQKFLNWSMGTSMKCSGIFGTKSTALLKRWQAKHGLKEDGIFGETSRTKAKNEIRHYAPKSAIGEQANLMAYKTDTSKADYPEGEPTEAYKEGLNEAYPNRSTWGTAPRKGASCDVFVGTCVRCSGVDKHFPRGLSPSYLANSKKFKRVSKKDVQDGDIICSPRHICIAYKGKIKEASHEDWYPKTTNTLKSRLYARGAKVYRAK